MSSVRRGLQMNNDNFQYRDTYFFIWNPVELLIAVLAFVLAAAGFILVKKKFTKKRKSAPRR